MNTRKMYIAEAERILEINGAVAKHDVMLRLTALLTIPGYTCLRPPGAAGAILVPDSYGDYADLLLIGCVEPPTGPTCVEVDSCEMENGHCVRTIHAEVNAILLAAYEGISTKNSTLYSLLKPCYQCPKVAVAAGVKKIIYAAAAYDEVRTRILLEQAGIEVHHVDIGLGYGH